MAQNGLAGLNAALKEDYQDPFRSVVWDPAETFNRIGNTKETSGLEAYMAVQTSPYLNTGARGEFQDLAPASSPGIEAVKVKTKTQTARLLFSAQEIDQASAGDESFVATTTFKMKAAAERIKRDLNRQFFGTSDGVLAKTGTTSAVNVVQLDTATPLSIMRFFEVGQLIDIGTTSDYDSIASGRSITAVDPVNRTITISGAAVTTSGTGRVSLYGNGGTNPQLEITGLQTAVNNTGTYFGIDPSTSPRWKSTVLGNNGTLRAASGLLFSQAIDDVRNESGKIVDTFIMPAAVGRNYAAQLVAQHVYNDGNFVAEGGYSGLKIHSTYGTAEGVFDRDCPDNTAFGLTKSTWTKFVTRDFNWDDRGGDVLRPVPNQLAYEAVMYGSLEFATDSRNAQVRINDLQETNLA